jgi:hypothetical protein
MLQFGGLLLRMRIIKLAIVKLHRYIGGDTSHRNDLEFPSTFEFGGEFTSSSDMH